MPRTEFENGVPRSQLDRSDLLDALQTRYGNFAISVLLGVKAIDKEAPEDILTFGDNWLQLVATRDYPASDADRTIQAAMGHASAFGDMWPIFGRGNTEDIYKLMEQLREGVAARSLDDRILKKLAVLDLAKDYKPLSPNYLGNRIETPWGVNGILKGTTTMIYHIDSGFACQYPVDVLGSPKDDLSGAIFFPGPTKD